MAVGIGIVTRLSRGTVWLWFQPHAQARWASFRVAPQPDCRRPRVSVAVNDATRLTYVEGLPDERKATTVGILTRALGWFSEQGTTLLALPVGQRLRVPIRRVVLGKCSSGRLRFPV